MKKASEKTRKTQAEPPAETATPESTQTTATPTAQPDRMALLLDPESGQVLWDRMRVSTKDQLKKAMADPRAARELGLVAASGETIADASDPALNLMVVNIIYDAISSLSVILAKNKGYGDDAQLLRYSAEEKQAFAEPTMKVLAKYNLMGGKYADELLLLGIVGSVTAGRFAAMKSAHELRNTPAAAATA